MQGHIWKVSRGLRLFSFPPRHRDWPDGSDVPGDTVVFPPQVDFRIPTSWTGLQVEVEWFVSLCVLSVHHLPPTWSAESQSPGSQRGRSGLLVPLPLSSGVCTDVAGPGCPGGCCSLTDGAGPSCPPGWGGWNWPGTRRWTLSPRSSVTMSCCWWPVWCRITNECGNRGPQKEWR